jgi:hypothetical protein
MVNEQRETAEKQMLVSVVLPDDCLVWQNVMMTGSGNQKNKA